VYVNAKKGVLAKTADSTATLPQSETCKPEYLP